MTANEAWIEQWCSWPPPADMNLQDEPLQAPKPVMVAAGQRRRLSRVSKMALHVTGDLLERSPQPDYAVFCSRHGELQRTYALLQQLAAHEELSPTAFAQSVHNTAAGHFCIAKQSQMTTTTISAGEQTLEMGWIEACAYLSCHPDARVLLVAFDEPAPSAYQRDLHQRDDIALAMMLCRVKPLNKSSKKLSLKPASKCQGGSADTDHANPIEHLAQLLQSEGALGDAFDQQLSHWNYNAGAA